MKEWAVDGFKLDRIDRRILMIMQKDGRISNLDLAEKVGLSPTPCARRVKRLEDAGIIAGHVTLLNQAALNLNLTAFVGITLDRHSQGQFESFGVEIQKHPEVVECSIVTGQSADILLKVIVQDMAHYEQFILGRLTKIEGVNGVHSSFVMRSIVNKTALPVEVFSA